MAAALRVLLLVGLFLGLVPVPMPGMPGEGTASAAETSAAETSAVETAAAIPRTILALVDLREEKTVRLTRIHSMAEMPMNHLGLTVVYWDVANGLPDLSRYSDLRGVVSWFAGEPFADAEAYIGWVGQAMDRGLRVAVLGQPGVRVSAGGKAVPLAIVNRFYARFGLRDDDGYSDLTYKSRPAVSGPMIGYERQLVGIIPGYPLLRKIDGRVISHLTMRRGDDPTTDSHIVVTGPMGGLVTEGYVRHYDAEINRRKWIVDPFAFFRAAFATDDLPKPDVTTLSGRRLYFSHIDGDGWRNVTEVPPYSKEKLLSADMVRIAAIEPYPDLPVAVAPIVGDLDAAWKGTPESYEAARRLFALPQVEPSSHTWTHPFMWGFFKDYAAGKEDAFETREAGYGGARRSAFDRLFGDRLFGRKIEENTAEAAGEVTDIGKYAIPRAYLQQPFDLKQEIGGALDYFTAMAPQGKKAVLVQWSGDTSPFEEAVAETRRHGGRNINGGDARFDADYPSITTVPPVGLPVGRERQIYAAGSNENTYTDLWTNRFFGYQNLINTVRNTDSPLRLKPFNIYYHMYSGQKVASLRALLKNLDAARAAEIAPVAASTYVAIAEGFYTARLLPDGERRWRIRDRGALNTLRFDRASFAAVDFARSAGVVGQRHVQGSLYVALDPAVAEPAVALAEGDRADVSPPAAVPYLIEGRWSLAGLAVEGQGFRVAAQGYGAGAMSWQVPAPGRYLVEAERDGTILWRGEAEAGADRILSLTVEATAIRPLILRVRAAAS